MMVYFFLSLSAGNKTEKPTKKDVGDGRGGRVSKEMSEKERKLKKIKGRKKEVSLLFLNYCIISVSQLNLFSID